MANVNVIYRDGFKVSKLTDLFESWLGGRTYKYLTDEQMETLFNDYLGLDLYSYSSEDLGVYFYKQNGHYYLVQELNSLQVQSTDSITAIKINYGSQTVECRANTNGIITLTGYEDYRVVDTIDFLEWSYGMLENETYKWNGANYLTNARNFMAKRQKQSGTNSKPSFSGINGSWNGFGVNGLKLNLDGVPNYELVKRINNSGYHASGNNESNVGYAYFNGISGSEYTDTYLGHNITPVAGQGYIVARYRNTYWETTNEHWDRTTCSFDIEPKDYTIDYFYRIGGQDIAIERDLDLVEWNNYEVAVGSTVSGHIQLPRVKQGVTMSGLQPYQDFNMTRQITDPDIAQADKIYGYFSSYSEYDGIKDVSCYAPIGYGYEYNGSNQISSTGGKFQGNNIPFFWGNNSLGTEKISDYSGHSAIFRSWSTDIWTLLFSRQGSSEVNFNIRYYNVNFPLQFETRYVSRYINEGYQISTQTDPYFGKVYHLTLDKDVNGVGHISTFLNDGSITIREEDAVKTVELFTTLKQDHHLNIKDMLCSAHIIETSSQTIGAIYKWEVPSTYQPDENYNYLYFNIVPIHEDEEN